MRLITRDYGIVGVYSSLHNLCTLQATNSRRKWLIRDYLVQATVPETKTLTQTEHLN